MSSFQWVEKKTSGWVQLAGGVDVGVAAEPVHSNCVSLTLLGDFSHARGSPLSWHPRSGQTLSLSTEFLWGSPRCLMCRWRGSLSVVVTKKFCLHGLYSESETHLFSCPWGFGINFFCLLLFFMQKISRLSSILQKDNHLGFASMTLLSSSVMAACLRSRRLSCAGAPVGQESIHPLFSLLPHLGVIQHQWSHFDLPVCHIPVCLLNL